MPNLLTNLLRGKNQEDKVDLKRRLGRSTNAPSFMRWMFFLSAVISCFILTTFKEAPFQAFGWALSTISCVGWVIIAAEDRDVPRLLMELMYAMMGSWGFINWIR
jgi:hypothetical protein